MFPHSVTDAIELRLLDESDARELFAPTDRNRVHLRKWLPWLDHTVSVEDSAGFIRGTLRSHRDFGCFVCGIWFHGALCGVIGHNRIDRENKATYLGYWLGEDFQGHGIVTACCRALIRHAFTEMEIHKVVITCGVENHRSQAIPDRLGFTREGGLRDAEWLYDQFIDHTVNSLLNPGG